MEREVYIVDGCRTGVGSFGGQFAHISAVELGATVIQGLLHRTSFQPEHVGAVVMGQVLMSGLGLNPARQAALKANIPPAVPAYSVNMVCGSALRAVYDAYVMIRSEEYDIIIAGGMENMTLTNHAAFLRVHRSLGTNTFQDCILNEGLRDLHLNSHIGETAEFIARKYRIRREAQDEYSFNSHMKAAYAILNGYFTEEITDVVIPDGDPIRVDESVRKDITIAKLASLKPAYSHEEDACITMGNSAGINDGAAAVLLCSAAAVKRNKFSPIAKIMGFAQIGMKPVEMGVAPIRTIKEVIHKVGWAIDDVDLFEINESFAVQALVAIHELDIDPSKVNVNGAAIALGNPLGASGARILVTLCHNLKRLGKSKGVAALAVGGGMAIAIAIEAC